MMKMTLCRLPDLRLMPFVDSMAVFHQDSAYDERCYLDIPTAYSYLIFRRLHSGGKTRGQLMVAGSHSELGEMPIKGVESMGARVRPGYLSAFLGAPAEEVQGKILPLEQFWGREAGDLLEKMWEAPTNEERLRIMEGVLLRRLVRSNGWGPFVGEAAHLIKASSWKISIRDLGDELGFTTRQLERKFRQYSGFTPKEFFKTLRCRSVTQRITLGQFRDWAQLVYDYNYYDQAHFINEFGDSIKQSPTDYFLQAQQNMEVVDDLTAIAPDDHCNVLAVPKNLVSGVVR